MAIYAIGDVQGCDHELGLLVGKLRFSADRDQLWFVGDLVNRGPDSLGVMRRLRALRDNVVVTLGNHDLHLLAVALGKSAPRKGDTLAELIAAPDLDCLLAWLVGCPFMQELPESSIAMLHAGLPPQWDMPTARSCARLAQEALRRDPEKFVANMYGNEPALWAEHANANDRLRFITNCFTRLRFVDAGGRLHLKEKGAPGTAPPGLSPWFAHRAARWRGTHVVFGHWSTLGFFCNDDVTGLDTGCGWGNQLTAVRLDAPDAKPIVIRCARRPD